LRTQYEEGVQLACWRMGRTELLPMFQEARFQESGALAEEAAWATAADERPGVERRCAILTANAAEAAAVAAMLVDGVELDPHGGTVSRPGRQQLAPAVVHVVWQPEFADRAAAQLEGVQQLFWVTDGSEASCRLFRDVSVALQPWRLGGHTTALWQGDSKNERAAARELQDRVMALLVTPPIQTFLAADGLADPRLALRVQERLLACQLSLRESHLSQVGGSSGSASQGREEEEALRMGEVQAALAGLERESQGLERESRTARPATPTGTGHRSRVPPPPQDGTA
jgi:hypothetical protein